MIHRNVRDYLIVNKWIYDIKRGLKLECKCPQKPDSVLRKKYGIKGAFAIQSVIQSDDSDDEDEIEEQTDVIALTPTTTKSRATKKTTGRGNSSGRGGRNVTTGGRGAGRSNGGGEVVVKKKIVNQKKEATSSSDSFSSEDDNNERSPIVGRKRIRGDETINKNIHEQQLNEMKAMFMDSQKLITQMSAKLEKQESEIEESKKLFASTAENMNTIEKSKFTFESNFDSTSDTKSSKNMIPNSKMMKDTMTSGNVNSSIPDINSISRINTKGFYSFIFQSGMNFNKSQMLEEQLEAYRRNEREANQRTHLQSLFEAFCNE
jgi:hypothetical protein